MYLKEIQIEGFKSFNKMTSLKFNTNITGIVGPNGSGKSNVTEAFRFVLGEQSLKTMRGRRGEDLIFNGGSALSRASRAQVTIIFDNKGGVFPYDFREISIARTVYRDGSNEYTINGSQVRQKDIVELLASVNVGATGHHIISQGEADRILNVSPEERKEFIEDGLGLKLLQFKKKESLKKLKKTRNNIDQADILLRELSPHLRHLKARVERYNAAQTLREELHTLYAEYLSIEENYIAHNDKELQYSFDILQKEVEELEARIDKEKESSEMQKTVTEFTQQAEENRQNLQDIRDKKSILERSLGRIEGEYAALQASREQVEENTIAKADLQMHYTNAQKAFSTVSNDTEYKNILTDFLNKIRSLLEGADHSHTVDQSKERELQEEQKTIREELLALEGREKKALEAQSALHKAQEAKMQQAHRSERDLLNLVSKKNEKEHILAEVRYKLQTLNEEKENFKREIAEAAVLLGINVDAYKSKSVSAEVANEARDRQRERRRYLERKKLELETIGTDIDESTYKEYTELNERIEFIQREKEDLFKSMEDCEISIQELQKEIDVRFADGLKKISTEFDRFFKILFGGGKASVTLDKKIVQKEEDEEPEIRLGVNVHLLLPQKKIHNWDQLSGGERALVSIALLFAISQVTPPPFLILDETDAALDEANSRRYGDMIEALAKQCQLILVTHNRETMLRAGVLYGVTMNSGGVSTLLSIEFEDAEKIAK